MKKFIFLDIDGVLNYENFYSTSKRISERKKYYRKFVEELENVPPGTNRKYLSNDMTKIDTNLVEKLNKLVDETDADIVLSSSWRFAGVEYMNFLFKQLGLKKPIVGRTPYLPDKPSYPNRGYEIKDYLKNEFNCKYVIFDDDIDMLEEQLPYFINVNRRVGLSDEDIANAKELLNS